MKLKKIDEAWLNIDEIDDKHLFNPINFIDFNDNNFHYRLLWLMTRPEYFSFLCKQILNINILPSQALFLCEMWNRKFPMLIASRGFGKMLKSEELLRTNNGWIKIKDVNIGDYIYGGDGKLTKVINKTELQTNLNMYKITLRDGRTIECCEDHQWLTYSQKNKTWNVLKTKEMLDFKRNRIGNKSNGTEYIYALPINKSLIEENESCLPIHPYIIGVLLGDGCLTQNRITFSSIDKHIVNKVNSLLPDGYYVSTHSDNITHGINTNTNTPFYKILEQVGIHKLNSKNKYIPNNYLYGSYGQKIELLQGLMDTDGYSNGQSVIEYYTISDQLNIDAQNIIRSLGIHCKSTIKPAQFKGKKYSDCHRITLYTDQPVFSLPRKLEYLQHTISKQGRSKYKKVFITNIEYVGKGEGYCIMVDNEDHTYITKDYIVTHNSFILSLYSILRALILPERKVVVVGAAFRQSKVLFEYMETIWNNAPILRSVCDSNSGPRRDIDRCVMRINQSRITCLPLGDGQKIRGQRANDIITDEFASVPRDIFETVVAGFAAVSSDPIENVKKIAAKKKAKELGINLYEDNNSSIKKNDNQIILSGTAYYDFNHFAEYWKKWKSIIKSQGKENKLRDIFGEAPPKDFNWEDYSIIRVPYELLPEGFMDASQVARSKATVHAGIYQMEFGACFTRDSQGFFKRTLIESCCVSDQYIDRPAIKDKNGNDICFQAQLRGDINKKYVFGVDPASEVDNFSITILELNEDHRRIVYCWTTNREQHKEKVKSGFSTETDFYAYCARKIRDLMKIFPCIHISIDAGGGGIAVMESLHDSDKIENGELPIWEIIDENKEKDTDFNRGLHILEMCQFSRYEWVAEANHGMRKDFEDKALLFPMFDTLSLDISTIEDELKGRSYDTLEQCVMEIEDLKDELSMIQITQTTTGRDKWDTPETVIGTGKKGKLRKDRYSSLLMANMAARTIARTPESEVYNFYGGFATVDKQKDKNGKLYNGPSWFTDGMNGVY